MKCVCFISNQTPILLVCVNDHFVSACISILWLQWLVLRVGRFSVEAIEPAGCWHHFCWVLLLLSVVGSLYVCDHFVSHLFAGAIDWHFLYVLTIRIIVFFDLYLSWTRIRSRGMEFFLTTVMRKITVIAISEFLWCLCSKVVLSNLFFDIVGQQGNCPWSQEQHNKSHNKQLKFLENYWPH